MSRFNASQAFAFCFALGAARRRVLALLMVAAAILGSAVVVQATETWAERLGYPSGQRVLMLYGIEMGTAFEMNKATAELLESGALQAAGAIAPAPWFAHAARFSRENPQFDVGLSLTLNSPWDEYRWRPLAPQNRVRGLIDPDGFMWPTVLQLSVNATAEEVEREARAQIERARAAGMQPGHLGLFLGAMYARPDYTAVYLKLAREYWLPAVVIDLTPAMLERFRQQGFPLEEELIDLIAGYPLPKIDNLVFSPDADSYEAKREALTELVRGLAPGITVIVFQPAFESEALQQITATWQQRVWDAQLLADPQVKELFQDEGVEFTNWKEMMRRFAVGGIGTLDEDVTPPE